MPIWTEIIAQHFHVSIDSSKNFLEKLAFAYVSLMFSRDPQIKGVLDFIAITKKQIIIISGNIWQEIYFYNEKQDGSLPYPRKARVLMQLIPNGFIQTSTPQSQKIMNPDWHPRTF